MPPRKRETEVEVEVEGPVVVAFGDNPSETATLLLAAAEDLGLDPAVVRTTSTGEFVVPSEVASKAKIKPEEE